MSKTTSPQMPPTCQISSSTSEAKLPQSGYSSSDQRQAGRQAGLQPPETLSNFLRIHFQHLGSTKSQQKHTATKVHLKAPPCQEEGPERGRAGLGCAGMSRLQTSCPAASRSGEMAKNATPGPGHLLLSSQQGLALLAAAFKCSFCFRVPGF